MPILTPSLTFQKSTEITKALRSRDASLLSLIPTARRVFDHESNDNSYFPRQNEWLLEWLAQRLKEEDGAAGKDARRSPQIWTFVCELLRSVDTASIAGTLKRHGIVASVARVMSELRSDLCKRSAASSSSARVEAGLEAAKIAALLAAVTKTLDFLREIAKAEISILVALRITIETSATILGDFLAVCEHLLRANSKLEQSCLLAVTSLWTTSIWGNSDYRKISTVWSEKCLCSATRLLALENIPPFLRSSLEDMIASCIFSPRVFTAPMDTTKASTKRSADSLLHLLAPLRQDLPSIKRAPSTLAVLFKIALSANSTTRNKPDANVIASIFEGLVFSVEGLDLNAAEIPSISSGTVQHISSLLNELISSGVSLPSEAMARIAVNIASLNSTATDGVQWGIVKSLLEVDFDTFLHPSHTDLIEALFAAISRSLPCPELDHVLRLLLEGFAKARDLTGFVERWQKELTLHPNHKLWTGDTLCETYAAHVELNLIPAQIVRLVNQLWGSKQLVILDATVRGVHKSESETKLAMESSFAEYVSFAVTDVKDWRRWRLLARVANIKPELLAGATSAAHAIIERGKLNGVMVFSIEVLLRMSQHFGDVETAQTAIQTISASWPQFDAWGGDLNSIKKSTFAYAASLGLVNQHLGLLENVDSATRNSFIDNFLQAALKSPQVQCLWNTMTENPEFYELPSLKDASLAALLRSTSPYNDMAHQMIKSVSANIAFPSDDMPRIQFAISNIYRYPLEALKRQSREQILNIAYLMHINGQSSLVLPLVRKLWKRGNATSYMASCATAFQTYFQQGSAEGPARQLLQHAVLNKDQDKVQEYLRDLVEIARGNITQQPEMCTVIVTELWKMHTETHKRPEALQSIRAELMQALQSQNTSASAVQIPTSLRVDLWRQLWELERDSHQDALKLVAGLSGEFVRASADTVTEPVSAIKLFCAVAESFEELCTTTAFVLHSSRSPKEEHHNQVLASYRSMVQRTDVGVQVAFTLWLTEGCMELSDSSIWSWRLLHEAISALKKIPVTESGEILSRISRLHNRLAICLMKAQSAEAMESICLSLDSLLQTHPGNLTQYDIETVLSVVSLSLSPRGPSFKSQKSDAVYISLVRLLSTVLSLHRHRIRGRYHLCTELLQSLLCCLFVSPPVRRKTQSLLSSRPPWLQGSVLSVASARAFSRVLHLFCEPPVSTVRTHGTELIDSQRGKEKRCVSKAVGPVLDMYARQLLEAKIAADVRKEIGLGIDSVLGVLGRDGLQKIVAGMSTEGRAVVRGLWAAYSRGGRERV